MNLKEDIKLLMKLKKEFLYNYYYIIILFFQKWDKLIEEPDFFHLYKYYVSITVSAATDENMEKYMGYCESRFRRVVESLGNKGIYENIHLYPVEYKNPSHV